MTAATVLFGLGAGLVVAEVAVRAFGSHPQRSVEEEVGIWVGRKQVFERRRLCSDPMMVTELVPRQHLCVPDGCVTINERGFRRSPTAPAIQGPELFTIAMIGDSFTYGYGVADEQSLPAHLEKIFLSCGYEQVRVLNFGVSGYNAVQSSRALVNKVMDCDPKIVIYSYARNDTELFWQEGNPTLWEVAPLFEGAPLQQRVLVGSRLYELITRRFALRRRAADGTAAYFAALHRPGWPGMWVARRSLDTMKRVSEHAGADLLVVLLSGGLNPEEAKASTGRIAAICDEIDVPTLDMAPPIYRVVSKAAPAKLWTEYGPAHFNDRGNNFIAQHVFRELVARFGGELGNLRPGTT